MCATRMTSATCCGRCILEARILFDARVLDEGDRYRKGCDQPRAQTGHRARVAVTPPEEAAVTPRTRQPPSPTAAPRSAIEMLSTVASSRCRSMSRPDPLATSRRGPPFPHRRDDIASRAIDDESPTSHEAPDARTTPRAGVSRDNESFGAQRLTPLPRAVRCRDLAPGASRTRRQAQRPASRPAPTASAGRIHGAFTRVIRQRGEHARIAR